MVLTLLELADISSSELHGDTQCQISNVAAIDKAGLGDISFVHSRKYKAYLSTTEASAVILPENLSNNFSGNKLINSDPYLAYAKIVTALFPVTIASEAIHPSATIHKTAIIEPNVHIAANVVIGASSYIKSHSIINANCTIGGNCTIGNATELKAHATLYDNVQLGENCLIHSGAVLGSDGFGFAPQKNNKWYKIPQIGNVVIGNDVEIGANTCVDCAALGSTTIGNGVKLDNLIQIGHNVSIGDNTAIAGHTAIAGSVKIGKRCRIGGAVAFAGHLEVTNDVTITATSFVNHSIHKAGVYSSGLTIDDNLSWRKNAARFKKLNSLYQKVLSIQKHIKKGSRK